MITLAYIFPLLVPSQKVCVDKHLSLIFSHAANLLMSPASMPLKNIWINWDKDPKNVWNSFWDRSNDKVVCRSNMSPMAFMLQAADLAFRGGSPVAHNEDVGQIQTRQLMLWYWFRISSSFHFEFPKWTNLMISWSGNITSFEALYSLCFAASCSLRTNQPRASAASVRGGPRHHKACGQGEVRSFFRACFQ